MLLSRHTPQTGPYRSAVNIAAETSTPNRAATKRGESITWQGSTSGMVTATVLSKSHMCCGYVLWPLRTR